MHGRKLAWLVPALAVALWSGSASAGNLDFSAYGAVQFCCEVETDGPQGGDNGVDLEATGGFGVGVDYSVWDYIDVGGRFGFLWVATEPMDRANIDRNADIDIDALIKGQYPFFDGQMEVYLAMPIGLTIGVLSDEAEQAAFGTGDYDTPVGMNVGLFAGYSYAFLAYLGAFVEFGWQLHWLKTNVPGGPTGDAKYESTYNQVGLNFGVFFRI
ncbi:MAG: hypothetical protein HY905_09335 [Deltaproteobacteria bacterium]|nr:hypothetical protein [Deltaproteobacteria bacterium]